MARVILFASPFPTVYRTGRLRRHMAAATAGSPAEGLEYIRSHAVARVATARERHDPALANRRRIEDATLAALKRYEPGFYAGRVDVFLPSEAYRRSGDRPDEWKRVAGQVVEHVGPDRCDGDYMLREPHVLVLAALLNQALRDEGGQHAAG